MAIVDNGRLRFERFADPGTRARCFFEWVYFANVASSIDKSDVYQCRTETGRVLAEAEDIPVDDRDCVVVGVPDTAKAAAASYAFHLGLPCMEGIMRNRYVGRTFIQPGATRNRSAWSKYTPLRSVLEKKRVFLVEDSIVRATTLRVLVRQLRELGLARQVHVRVACPPIVAPCFYGIDMSTLGELFAPGYVRARYDGNPRSQTLAKMAENLGIDSLRYLNVSDLGECLGCSNDSLCLGCVTGKYPTRKGGLLMRKARAHRKKGKTGRVVG
jgi:amidophosphoribosyltransferase